MAAKKTTTENLAALVDNYYQAHEDRLAADKSAAKLKDVETALRASLLSKLQESGATGVAGNVARANLVVKNVFQASDWEAVRAYIKKTGSWDLLQKRLSDTAVRERFDAGKPVPGVSMQEITDLSIGRV